MAANKPKTTIIYAAAADIPDVIVDVQAARDRGMPVRVIALEEFRGETEQNAGPVYVGRTEGDELLLDRIQQAYPLIEVQNFSGSLDFDKPQTFQSSPQTDGTVNLRMELIKLGGSAPAGASDSDLADLIAAQRAHTRHIPIFPNPATQGTTIPDATPIIQRAEGDRLIDSRSTGASPEALKASKDVAGEGVTGTQTATHSQPLKMQENERDNASHDADTRPTAAHPHPKAPAAKPAAKPAGSSAK